ncbi:hypothetical protein ATCC90586_000495 [Pythium insidiosum]|nr:hypothetical protein ATCC90586_000495 [Pythium insidiosum]
MTDVDIEPHGANAHVDGDGVTDADGQHQAVARVAPLAASLLLCILRALCVYNESRAPRSADVRVGTSALHRDVAVPLAVNAVVDWLKKRGDDAKTWKIIFNTFLQRDYELYQMHFRQEFGIEDPDSTPFLPSPADPSLVQARKLIDDADYVLVSAGAGLSAAAGLDYNSEELMQKLHGPLQKIRPQLRTLYSTIGFSQWSTKVMWGYLLRHASIARFNWAEHRTAPTYQQVAAICDAVEKRHAPSERLESKAWFVVTSNADGMFEQEGFADERVFMKQGEYGRIQCRRPCRSDSVFDVRPFMERALKSFNPKTYEIEDPEGMPRCPNCGGDMFLLLRIDGSFLESALDEGKARYHHWLSRVMKDVRENGKKLAILEVGVGFNTPGVLRIPNERLATEPGVSLVRVNTDHPEVPFASNGVGVGVDANEALRISFGSACLFTLVASVYACNRIIPIFISTGWYGTNLIMLGLTVLQMAFLVYECFIQNTAKILVIAKFCRALQVAVSCMLYGRLACDMINRSRLYYQLLAPIVITTMVATAIDVVFVIVLEDEIDCHHVSWLISSMASFVLSSSFALAGRVVLDEIKNASRMQCNVVSTTFQVAVDIYVTYGVVGRKTCNSMFFEDGSGAFEQFGRFIVSLVSFLVPNWATLFVFFLLPRHQFSTALDVPDLAQEDSYELLLAAETEDNEHEQELVTMSSRHFTALTSREKAMHGRYLIRESFANGSYGQVCAGEDLPSRQQIAVKIIPKSLLLSVEEKQSVIREQLIHRSLDHPHIIKLIDVFEDDGAHYFILERAENGSLSALLTYAGMPEEQCRDVFAQLLSALDYLHRHSIVHHDIKPQNILLHHGKRAIKLCDFGASRAFNEKDAALPFAGVFGTPGYIAPELLMADKAYGPAIDMFSAGILLYEMVFGFMPFYPPSACTYQALEFPRDSKASLQSGKKADAEWRHSSGGSHGVPRVLVNTRSLTLKLQTIPMRNYPLFLNLLTTFVYIPISFAYIIPMIKYGSAITLDQRSVPKKTFAVMGALDSMAGILQVFAATYLGGSLIILLGQAAIPVSMVISSALLKTRYTIYQYVGAIVVTVGLVVVLGPGFLIALPLTIPAATIGDPPVSPDHIMQNLYDGLKCYMGQNSITEGAHKDDCERATVFVTAYLLFNVAYNLLIILILKFGSANILWLAMTIMVPLGNVAFTFPFMPEHQPLHTKDIVGLVFIMAGLFVYRFLEDMSKKWHKVDDLYEKGSSDNSTSDLKKALIHFEDGRGITDDDGRV